MRRAAPALLLIAALRAREAASADPLAAPPPGEPPRVECRVARDAGRAEVARLSRVTTAGQGRTSTRMLLSSAASGSGPLQLSVSRPARDPMGLAEKSFGASLETGRELLAVVSPVEARTVVRGAGEEVRIETAELRLRTVRCHLRALADEVDGRLLAALEEARRVLAAPGAEVGEAAGLLDVLSIGAPGEGPAMRWEEAPAEDCVSLMAKR